LAIKDALCTQKNKKSKKRSLEAKRIKKLEKELARKDKALAEVTALPVLKKTGGLFLGGRGRHHPKEERQMIIEAIDEVAREWVECYVHWYNNEHLHSAIRYVTLNQSHAGEDEVILAQRQKVYERANQKHPQRWSGKTRNWDPIEEVYLNPEEPGHHDNPRRHVPRKEAS